MPPQQVYLARAEAEVFGIQVSASGRLLNPQVLWAKAGGSKPPPVQMIARVIEELKALKFEAAPPVLAVTFSGDLAEPEKVQFDLSLWGEKIRREGYLVESLYVSGGHRDGVMDLKQLRVSDAGGKLEMSGTFQPSTKTAQVTLRSSLDIQSVAQAFRFAPQLGEFVFYGAPTIETSLHASFGEKPQLELLGHASLQRFSYKSVMFDGLNADFSWDGRRWSARDLLLKHRTGEAKGDVMQVPGDIRAQLKSTLNPKALQPLLSGKAFEFMSLFEFQDSPEIEIEARGAELTKEALSAKGKLRLGATTFRGVPAESMVTDFEYKDRELRIAPFRVQRSEGSGSGGLIFDFRDNEVRLEKIRANVWPAEVINWIEPKLLKDVVPYRFKNKPPSLFIDGLVHTKGGTTTRLNIDIDAPAGMDYTFLKRELKSPQISGKLNFTSERLRISDLNGALFGGRVKGTAEVSIKKERPGHKASVVLEGVDFPSLTKLYFSFDSAKGRLNARYDFSGKGGDARTMEGRGQLAVTEGNVFAIPFLGPLSSILNTIVPGMGYNVARKATTTFTIDQGVIATNDLEIQGQGFSMYGGGKLFFLDDRMAFDMRINAQGLPGVLLFPVSKLFEYTADEKLSKPTWRPKVVPKF